MGFPLKVGIDPWEADFSRLKGGRGGGFRPKVPPDMLFEGGVEKRKTAVEAGADSESRGPSTPSVTGSF